MSGFMDLLKQRRSVRKYEETDVPPEMVDQVLEAVRWTQSWANTQCWEVVVIRDPGVKEQIQATIAPKNPATKAIVAAPVLLALCGKLKTSGYYDGKVTTKFGDWFMFDLGLATQSLCLAAAEMGLGTVVVGLYDHEKAKAVLNIPDGYELVALIPLGYPAKISSPPSRREVKEFVHMEKF